jgi:hypothetical protein
MYRRHGVSSATFSPNKIEVWWHGTVGCEAIARAEDENGRLLKLLAGTDAGQRHAARHQLKKW